MIALQSRPGIISLFILCVSVVNAAEGGSDKQTRAKAMYYQFPTDAIQCRQGDYIIRQGNDQVILENA